jgi:hypothetical protein
VEYLSRRRLTLFATRSSEITMSQIYSTNGRYLKDRGGHIGAYSGLPFPPPTDRSSPGTHTSRATTTTKVPNVKQSYPTATSKPRSKSHSRRAPTTEHPTKQSSLSQQSKPSTRRSSLAPVSQNNTGNDVKSMRSGFSGHDAEPADGAQFGDLSESNVRGLGPSTGGGRSVLDSWVGKSLRSAENQGFYEVVKYRKGLGNRRQKGR